MNTIEKAKEDIIKADEIIKKLIKKRTRYNCGLVSDEYKNQVGCGDLFFESPDGQNGQLFYELKKLGYENNGYNAEYYWKVSKGGIQISYTEGDIYIKKL